MIAEEPRFDLTTLGPQHVALLGQQLRERASSAASVEDAAAVTVSLLFDALRGHDGRRATALARVFRTTALGELGEPEQRAARELAGVELGADVRCLTLLATRGIEPAWNDRLRSRGHRAIPLPTPAAIEQLPMISALLRQLGIDVQHVVHGDRSIMVDASERTFSAFHVPVAVDSPYIPAQRDFVLRYKIASAFGFGGVLPSSEVFAAIVFTTVPVSEDTASAFETLALHLRLALIDAAPPAVRASAASLRSRAAALDQLLTEQQSSLVEWASRLAMERDAERVRHEAALAARAEQLHAQNEKLERAHRAMLNVVEDLRDARADLARRVTERTEELRVANAALLESNHELEQFAYVASHDLQEPLRTVTGYLQILEERYGDRLDQDAHEFMAFAVTGARRMQELIESLLLYSRVTTQPHARREVSLDGVLAEIRELLAAAIADTGAVIHHDPLPSVLGDPVQIRQVFQNLIANSIKFAGDAPLEIVIRARDAGHAWEIDVEDNGLGFQPRFAETVFKVFRRLRRDKPGTGIGLAIVKKIVERHGGSIRADATPGKGARFTITLPKGGVFP